MSELRPALASGAPGLCKDVEARVTQLSGDRTGERKQAEDLATRLLAGEPVTFRDESEQEHVLRVAQEMAVPPPSGQEVVAGADQASTKYEGETVGFQPVGLDGRTALLEMCVRGTYEGPEGSQTKMGGSSGKRGKGSKDGMDGDGVLQAIHRVTRLNSTYRPREEQEVMDRVRNFLPKPKPAATARARR
ncbi:MAG: hypothetical protein M1838_005966 [Thelocarpon superellum]|nr:MAG: hypothetical protein M1838_005966 [Thelocarpon superellum]